MQDGEAIAARYLDMLIPEIADELGITCRSFSSNWVHQLSLENVRAEIFGYKFGINGAAAAAIAGDKVATSDILRHNGISAVEHVLLHNYQGQLKRYGSVEGEVVAKPLSGSGGWGVQKFANQAEAEQVISESERFAWAISPYREIAREIRIIMLDGEILLAYEKTQPVVRDGLKMFNLGAGAKPLDIQPHAALADMVRETMMMLNLRLASVDVVELQNGELCVMEVNDGIMMEHYMRQSDDHRARGKAVYVKIIRTLVAG
jgi:glutathione synthase/RimK-type ligase-like ATP-grasp enzyme